MSLLQNIQNDAINENVDISTLLRKCKVLASRLGNEEFKLWVEHELNGYSSINEVPQYRILTVESVGHFFGIAGNEIKNAPIAASSLPKKYQEFVNTEYLIKPISYYYSLIKDGNSSKSLQSLWSAEFIKYCSDKLYDNMYCGSAWKIIPFNAIVTLVDTVRNRILSFSLEIEEEAPDIGETALNSKPISNEKVSQVFNNYILGNVTNFSEGDQVIIRDIEINVKQNDFDSLKDFLSSLNIGTKDIEELNKAIIDDGRIKETLGDKVKGWINNIQAKTKEGIWKVAVSVATQLVTKAILKYYGIE